MEFHQDGQHIEASIERRTISMREPKNLSLAFLVLGMIFFSPLSGYAVEEDADDTFTADVDTVEESVDEETTVIVDEELTPTEVETDFENELALKEQARKQEASDHFQKAQSAREAGNLGEAVTELLTASELDPENVDYTTMLQTVQAQYVNQLLRAADYELAISVAERHLESFPDDNDVKNLLNTAKELKEGVATEVVVEKDEEIIPMPVKETKTAAELYTEAKAAYRLKDYEEAKRLLQKAHDLDPFSVRITLLLNTVNEQLYRYARSYKLATMRELLTQVEQTWAIRPRGPVEVPIDFVGPPEPDIPDSRKRIEQKLNTIIPKVEFTDAKLKEVIDYLSKKVDVSIVIDESVFRGGPIRGGYTGTGFGTYPEVGPGMYPGTGGGTYPGGSMPGGMPGGMPGSGPPTGTGFPGDTGFGADTGFATDTAFPETGVMAQPVDQGGITITLKDIPLKEVLKYVLRMKNLKYSVDDYAIVVLRAGDVLPEELETEIFRLSTSGTGVASGSLPSGGASAFSGGSTGFGSTGPGSTGFGSSGFGGVGMGGTTGLGVGTGVGLAPAPAGTEGIGNIRDFLLNSGVQWPRGSNVIFHQPTATLIVRNTPTNLALIRELIRVYDTPPMQVEIEARFVEVQLTKLFENTFRIGMTNALTWARKSDLAAGKPLTSIERITGLFDPRNTIRTSETIKGSGGNILSISGILTEPEFSIVWYALDQNQYSELLNAPKVTTRSGQAAQIQVTETIRYPTEFEVESIEDIFVDIQDEGDFDWTGFSPFYVTPESFEERDVGTILTVIPTVSADNRVITLVLWPEVSELLGWDVYGGSVPIGAGDQQQDADAGFTGLDAPQPRFGQRVVSTTVHVNDGETIVLGGLITERTARYRDKVPILGSIPFVGRLFKNELDDTYKRNLIIFVTARLITSRGTEYREEVEVSEILKARYEEGQRKAAEEEDMSQ
jgi:type II secretory pathway component GspD/PulD (secretin)/tetratricopeptide (TPR) repeat protein